MFGRLKALYKNGTINVLALTKAVGKRWITEEQKQQIVNTQ